MTGSVYQTCDYPELGRRIKAWAKELGFAEARFTRATLPDAAAHALEKWLANQFHGEMGYMATRGALRVRPSELVPGTVSIISVRMPYWPSAARPAEEVLADGARAYISRYALGRDYHKVLRQRLQRLARSIQTAIGSFGFRAFADSAPVAEVALAAQAGLGWRGKHTLLLTRQHGSLFFLGELFTDLPLPEDPSEDEHCGRCTRCLDICPTGAIIAPGTLDARLCISYLTIELPGAIPEALRPLIGNRVYGCDDCQLFCPWNRFAVKSDEPDFAVRHGLDNPTLAVLFGWSRELFEKNMAGSAIFRIGYERWLRNLAVGLGNAPTSNDVVNALLQRQFDSSALVREHVTWALARHAQKESPSRTSSPTLLPNR